MKYCRVEIHKSRSADFTEFAYPPDYDPRDHQCLVYQNEGLNVEYAVTLVPDDFDFSPDGFEELSQVEATALMDAYKSADKDLGEEDRTDFKTRRLLLAAEQAIISRSVADARDKPFIGTPPRTWQR